MMCRKTKHRVPVRPLKKMFMSDMNVAGAVRMPNGFSNTPSAPDLFFESSLVCITWVQFYLMIAPD
jgi:hypothetical protein